MLSIRNLAVLTTAFCTFATPAFAADDPLVIAVDKAVTPTPSTEASTDTTEKTTHPLDQLYFPDHDLNEEGPTGLSRVPTALAEVVWAGVYELERSFLEDLDCPQLWFLEATVYASNGYTFPSDDRMFTFFSTMNSLQYKPHPSDWTKARQLLSSVDELTLLRLSGSAEAAKCDYGPVLVTDGVD